MKYICFYNDGQYYYCYSEDKRYYKGQNAVGQNAVKNFSAMKNFIYIMLLNIITGFLNEIFKNRINNIVCLIIISLGIIVSVIMGNITYKKIITEADKELAEIYLSDEQFKEFIIQGRKRLSTDIAILFSITIVPLFCFTIFYFERRFSSWILGIIFSYALAMLFKWIAP